MLHNFNGMQISFRGSILGFENLDVFIVEAIEDTPFGYLKSLQDEHVSFLITSPFEWYSDYAISLDDSLKKKLQLAKPEDTLVFCIVTIKGSIKSSTINLLAPLVININQFIGNQFVIQEKTNYKTNMPLITSGNREEGEGE